MQDLQDKNHLEHLFIELFEQDNIDKCTVHFDYTMSQKTIGGKNPATSFQRKEDVHLLKVTTYNPKKNVSFLLLEVEGKTEIEVINLAYQLLCKMRSGNENYQTYTLEWSKIGENITNKSYFCAKNPIHVLTKFYSEFEKYDSVVFYSLKMNPIA